MTQSETQQKQSVIANMKRAAEIATSLVGSSPVDAVTELRKYLDADADVKELVADLETSKKEAQEIYKTVTPTWEQILSVFNPLFNPDEDVDSKLDRILDAFED